MLISIVPIVVAVLSLLLWRLWRVRRLYRKRARDEPQLLVDTTDAGSVVGRNGLCDVLQDNLQDRGHRRAQLLIGGVGVGKTAVLVRLTRLLALRGAVPVPIRLREAQEELDFLELAHDRFLGEVESRLLSDAEGDKIWRKLLDEDRIVVLADGLEEALSSGKAERSRDATIRLAFIAASRNRLPLVVTARPHDAMRYLDAAALRLEPLSEAAALEFICSARPDDAGKVRRIVERAEVVEAPLYMQLTRQLHHSRLLDDIDARTGGRLGLRVRLLDAWRQSLVDRKLLPGIPYTPRERARALADLQALACVGLAADSLTVAFDDLRSDTRVEGERADQPAPDFRELLARECSDLRLAAGVGSRLDIVEATSQGVRFRHSIVQAYLGSRCLHSLLGDQSDYLDQALANPGREALMALIMHCHRDQGASDRREVRDRLLHGPKKPNDTKAIDMFAAAVEIDGMMSDAHEDWLSRIDAMRVTSEDDDTEQAQLRALARLGEEGRAPSAHGAASNGRRHNACTALWDICVRQQNYRVRLAAAQELGAAGSAAFDALEPVLREALDDGRILFASPTRPFGPVRRRTLALQGWVLPLLAASVEPEHVAGLERLIADWIDLLRARRSDTSSLCSIEASWAQGFKYEANLHPSSAHAEMRRFLFEQAQRMAESTQFWYSRICLLHAFTLWSLPHAPHDGDAGRSDPEGGHAPRATSPGNRREYARRVVASWAIGDGHPFVAEARDLCERALRNDEPGKYIWIDEAGVVAKLGPRADSTSEIASSRLRISPAAGWLALDDRARRLVAEIVVLLNLAEGIDPTTSESRLQALGNQLPFCMTQPGGRKNLQIGGEEIALGPRLAPICRGTCHAGLCPYPAPGHEPFRGELSEAFCREQLRILHRGRALWQSAQSRKELRRFWKQMEARAGP
jgi:hypothetical protein